MKRRAVAILVTGMIMASLTGCGTEAKATNQEVTTKEETIIVTDEDSSENDTIEKEKVIVGEKEADDVGVGDIVFYDEIGKYPDYLLSDVEYETMEDKVVTAVNDIPVYSGEGMKVGYVKGGATVILTEHGINTRWYRFENPVSNTDYDYLCMLDDDIPSEEIPMLSAEEVKAEIIAAMLNRTDELPTILDAPTSDMEVYECRILREDDPGNFTIRRMNALENMDTFDIGNYMTYYVECEEDGEFAICRIYYKDSRF